MNLSIYKIGDYVVDTDYEKPTKEKFLLWREDFLNEVGHLKFDFVFRGNAAEIFYGNSTLETYDVDIFFSSQDKTNYNDVKLVFDSAINLGAKHKIFIDIFHVSKNVFENKLLENFVTLRPWFNITYKNGETHHSSRRYKKIIKGVYSSVIKREIMAAYKEWVRRQNDGHYQGLILDLHTLENKNQNI